MGREAMGPVKLRADEALEVYGVRLLRDDDPCDVEDFVVTAIRDVVEHDLGAPNITYIDDDGQTNFIWAVIDADTGEKLRICDIENEIGLPLVASGSKKLARRLGYA